MHVCGSSTVFYLVKYYVDIYSSQDLCPLLYIKNVPQLAAFTVVLYLLEGKNLLILEHKNIYLPGIHDTDLQY